MDPYVDNGYANRNDYLECLSEDYSVDLNTVKMMADLLGPSEDFDGLVSALDDMEEDLFEDDGQPTEMEEWHDFDPDC